MFVGLLERHHYSPLTLWLWPVVERPFLAIGANTDIVGAGRQRRLLDPSGPFAGTLRLHFRCDIVHRDGRGTITILPRLGDLLVVFVAIEEVVHHRCMRR